MDNQPQSNNMVDIIYGGAYAIKSYYMESDNPRQMRGASQLLLDAIMPAKSSLPQRKEYAIRSIQDDLQGLQGDLFYNIGATFLGWVPAGKGKEAAALCENRYRALTVTACFATVWLPNIPRNDLETEQFSNKLHPQLLSLFDKRRFMLLRATGEQWDQRMEELIQPGKPNLYIHSKAGLARAERCSRCNMRSVWYYGSLTEEGTFDLCPSCAHKEYRGGYIQRNRFRDECAAYAQDIHIKIATPNDDPASESPIWFGKTDDYADKNGDIALLYADINNLGNAIHTLKPYDLNRYMAFGEAVANTVKTSLYQALAVSVKQAYEQCRILYPDSYDMERGFPACFEIVSVGGDDICVLVPGTIALKVATGLVDEFHRRWDAIHKATYGFSLSLSAGVAVGQTSTPVSFMLDTAEQLLAIAKKRAHQEGAQTRGALDILNLNSDGQWAASVERKLRGQLHKNEGARSAALTLRPFNTGEAVALLKILSDLKDHISASMLRSLSEASEKLTIEESKLYAQYLWSKQDKERESLENLYERTRQMVSGRQGRPFDMFIDVEGNLVSPWRDLAELQGQMG